MNESTRNKRTSRRLERKVADSIGGRWSSSSGAVGDKGDVRLRGRYRIEHKFTKNSKRAVTLAELNKAESECYGTEKPAFIVEFVDSKHHSIDCVVFLKEWATSDTTLKVAWASRSKKSVTVQLEAITLLRASCFENNLTTFAVDVALGWVVIPYNTWIDHVNNNS